MQMGARGVISKAQPGVSWTSDPGHELFIHINISSTMRKMSWKYLGGSWGSAQHLPGSFLPFHKSWGILQDVTCALREHHDWIIRFIGAGKKTQLTNFCTPLQNGTEILLVQGRLDEKCNEKAKKCLRGCSGVVWAATQSPRQVQVLVGFTGKLQHEKMKIKFHISPGFIPALANVTVSSFLCLSLQCTHIHISMDLGIWWAHTMREENNSRWASTQGAPSAQVRSSTLMEILVQNTSLEQQSDFYNFFPFFSLQMLLSKGRDLICRASQNLPC